MTRPALLSPAARAAAAEAVTRTAEQDTGAARRMRTAVVEAARLIGARPAIGRRHPALLNQRYRLWSLAGFPYLLVYDPEPHPPQILRLVHTARDLPNVLRDLGS